MKTKAFRVLKQSDLNPEASPGVVVFRSTGSDYGVASDDTRMTGVEHISVTLKKGQIPFFTIPLRDLEEVVVDTINPPTNEEAKTLCKVGQGAECCRYLTMAPSGWSCEKLEYHGKTVLDSRVEKGQMTARGDNCEGKGLQ